MPVPIVLALIGDPVRSGVVASLARPGGNITGVSNLAPRMVTKRLSALSVEQPAKFETGDQSQDSAGARSDAPAVSAGPGG
jgi:ABC transporter substrate binding protein